MTGALGLASVVALTVVGCSDDDRSETSARAPRTSAPSASVPIDWSNFGFDTANSRFNPNESTIDATTVADLKPTWTVELGTGVASTPAVVDGTVYVGTFDKRVLAMDASTGEISWETEVDSNVMSSITVTGDAAYAATGGKLYRLDRATGEIQWTAVTSEHPIAISPASPVIAGDVVIQGTASGELMIPVEDYTFRGSVAGFDVRTGRERWRLWLTADDETTGAGVGVWSTPSVDFDRGLAFFGTGNTYEPPASAYADSIVAIDYQTGEVAWKTQFTNPDVWSTSHKGGLDADVGAGPNLWTVGDVDMVGAGDKRGTYHALNRDTGAIEWETQMTAGSVLGGVIGTSASTPDAVLVASNNGNAESNLPGTTASVVALNPADGSEKWSVELDAIVYAPVTAIPGVAFVGTTGGEMVALDSDDGATLWSFTAADQVGSGPTIVNGTVYWGYGFALFGPGSGKGGIVAFSTGSEGAQTDEGTESAEPASAGERLFRMHCASCHGLQGQGAVGPSFKGIVDRLTEEEHLAVVKNGKRTQMPAFGGSLTDDEIAEIVRYEREVLNDG